MSNSPESDACGEGLAVKPELHDNLLANVVLPRTPTSAGGFDLPGTAANASECHDLLAMP